MFLGPTPAPISAPPATGFEEVTKGYVPWSRSRKVACAPSNSTFAPSSRASWTKPTESAVVGRKGQTVGDLGQDEVLLLEDDLELLPEDLGVEQVLDPQADAGRLVGV